MTNPSPCPSSGRRSSQPGWRASQSRGSSALAEPEVAPPPAPSGPEPEPEDFEDDGDFANQMDTRLFTPDGDPVAGESFEVVDETGSVVHEGVLGDDGTATVVGLPPGNYTVDFPRLHGDSWESATV